MLCCVVCVGLCYCVMLLCFVGVVVLKPTRLAVHLHSHSLNLNLTLSISISLSHSMSSTSAGTICFLAQRELEEEREQERRKLKEQHAQQQYAQQHAQQHAPQHREQARERGMRELSREEQPAPLRGDEMEWEAGSLDADLSTEVSWLKSGVMRCDVK